MKLEFLEKLSKEERKQLDEAMDRMLEKGFYAGYEFARQQEWILAGEGTPRTPELVEVTVELPDGTRRTAKSKFTKGKWTNRLGETVAWKPIAMPCFKKSAS